MLKSLLTSKENYYTMAKVMNFVDDFPAREMKANVLLIFLKILLLPLCSNTLHAFSMCRRAYGCPKLLDMHSIHGCHVQSGSDDCILFAVAGHMNTLRLILLQDFQQLDHSGSCMCPKYPMSEDDGRGEGD